MPSDKTWKTYNLFRAYKKKDGEETGGKRRRVEEGRGEERREDERRGDLLLV